MLEQRRSDVKGQLTMRSHGYDVIEEVSEGYGSVKAPNTGVYSGVAQARFELGME